MCERVVSGSEKILELYSSVFLLFLRAACPMPKAQGLCHHLVWGPPLCTPQNEPCPHSQKEVAMQGQCGSSSQGKESRGTPGLVANQKAPSLSPVPPLEMLTLNLSKLPQGYSQALWASELGSFSPCSFVNPRPKPGNQSLPPSQILCPGQTQKENNTAPWTSGHLGEVDKPLGHWKPPGLVSLGAPTFLALSPMGPARGPRADVRLFSPQATPVPCSVQLL